MGLEGSRGVQCRREVSPGWVVGNGDGAGTARADDEEEEAAGSDVWIAVEDGRGKVDGKAGHELESG